MLLADLGRTVGNTTLFLTPIHVNKRLTDTLTFSLSIYLALTLGVRLSLKSHSPSRTTYTYTRTQWPPPHRLVEAES